MIHRIAVVLTISFLSLLPSPGARAGDDKPPVSPADQLQFQQRNAQAQMQELQERMFRLAELTRETEPDDASRLLMAVRKAREQLILEQMTQALELLATKDFTHAADEQAEVIRKLEELKRLLTSTDLDLQLQLEKLRALNQAIAKLDAATKEEKRQRDRSGEFAKKPPADAAALGAHQQDQKQNRRATESIAQTVKDLGASAAKAGATLGGACQSMSLAEGDLGNAEPSDAQAKQADAVRAMREARKQLADERDRILQDLERMVRRQVVENLTEMLDRQKSIRAATEAVVNRMNSGQRDTIVRVKQLGKAETAIVRIADQTLVLIEETQFSVALPPALRRVQQKCALIAATLDDAQADGSVVAREIEVENDLQDLLDTFKQLAASRIGEGNCRGCKGNPSKLLAELKVVRMMQARVSGATKSVDGERPEGDGDAMNLPPNTDPMLRDKILAVRDGEAEVRDAMRRIQEQLNAPDEPVVHEDDEEDAR